MSKAAVKRAMAFGTEWEVNWLTKGVDGKYSWGTPKYRRVVKVQTNAVAMAKEDTPEHIHLAEENPHRNASWLYFDQKDGAKYNIDGGVITIQHEDGFAMKYTPKKES